eukprot:jgi/Psemu1/63305/estExt_Genemark1.C_220031
MPYRIAQHKMHPTTNAYRPSRKNRRIRPREECGKSTIRKSTLSMNMDKENDSSNSNNSNSNSKHDRVDYATISRHVHRSLSGSVSSSSLSSSSRSTSERSRVATNPSKRNSKRQHETSHSHEHSNEHSHERARARYPRTQSPSKQRAEPPSSSSSSSSKKNANVMVFIKQLFLRCFLARRKRKLKRMVAKVTSKKMQRNNNNNSSNNNSNNNNNTFQTVLEDNHDPNQLRSTVPSNETEMYLVLRSKRSYGSSSCETFPIDPPQYEHAHAHAHQHDHPSTPVTNRQRRTYSDDDCHTRHGISTPHSAPPMLPSRTRATTIASTCPLHIFLEHEQRRAERESMRSLL